MLQMYPNPDDYFATGVGSSLFLLTAIGAIIGYVAMKIRIIQSFDGLSGLAGILAICVAGWCAFNASSPPTNGWLIDLLGRAAIFLLVFFVVGIFIGIGIVMGAEIASDKSEKK